MDRKRIPIWRWCRNVALWGLVVAMGLTLLPLSALAYATPWSGIEQAVSPAQGATHSQDLALLEESSTPAETVEPTATQEVATPTVEDTKETETPEVEPTQEPETPTVEATKEVETPQVEETEEPETPEPEETEEPGGPEQTPAVQWIEFAGRIEALPSDGLIGTWTVAGQTFTVDSQTRITRPEGLQVAVGDWAEVKAQRRADGSLYACSVAVRAPQVTLRGPISALPESLNNGVWTVAGQAVQVTPDTRLSERAARAEVGAWADVLATESADGQLVALRVVVMHPDRLVRVVGAIERLSDTAWVVSGVTVTVNAQTRIVGTPVVGLLADVHGRMDQAGAFVAELITVRGTLNKPPLRHLVTFEGVVKSIPAGRVGDWVITSGGIDRTVAVSTTTTIDERKGPAEVGALVLVRAVQQDGGPLQASTIVVNRPVGTPVAFQGLITLKTSIPGTWEIGGRQVAVTANTQLDEHRGPAEVGSLVLVTALRQPGQDVLLGLGITVLRSSSLRPTRTPFPTWTPGPRRTPGPPVNRTPTVEPTDEAGD